MEYFYIILAVCTLSARVVCDPGSHSLWVLATFLTGERPRPIPEFTAVVMLDDIVIGHYVKDDRSLVQDTLSKSENITEQLTVSSVLKGIHGGMKSKAFFLIRSLNYTRGLHVQQRLVGCELVGGEVGGMMTLEALDGGGGFERRCDTRGDQLTRWAWPELKSRAQLEYDAWLYTHFYRPLCVSQLRKYLHLERKRVMARVKPRVRVFKHANASTGVVGVTCLATGFYPRHINVTLLRDGRPLSDQRVTAGAVLPNADGTYQTRKSVELSAGEEPGLYTCAVTHLSLDNKLDISIEPGPAPGVVVPCVLVILGLCVIGGLAALIRWRLRSRESVQVHKHFNSRTGQLHSYSADITKYLLKTWLVWFEVLTPGLQISCVCLDWKCTGDPEETQQVLLDVLATTVPPSRSVYKYMLCL